MKYSWYLFLLEAEATPGEMVGYLAKIQMLLRSEVLASSTVDAFFSVY